MSDEGIFGEYADYAEDGDGYEDNDSSVISENTKDVNSAPTQTKSVSQAKQSAPMSAGSDSSIFGPSGVSSNQSVLGTVANSGGGFLKTGLKLAVGAAVLYGGYKLLSKDQEEEDYDY